MLSIKALNKGVQRNDGEKPCDLQLVGVPTGIVILQGVLRIIATLNPGLTLNFLISFERILLAFGLAMFSSFLGVLYPSIRALKVKPVEALKYRG